MKAITKGKMGKSKTSSLTTKPGCCEQCNSPLLSNREVNMSENPKPNLGGRLFLFLAKVVLTAPHFIFDKMIKHAFDWHCPECGSKEFYKTYTGIRCKNCEYRRDW